MLRTCVYDVAHVDRVQLLPGPTAVLGTQALRALLRTYLYDVARVDLVQLLPGPTATLGTQALHDVAHVCV